MTSTDSPCPDDSELADFIEHRLPAERAQAVELHLDGCSDCREVFAQLARVNALETPSIALGVGPPEPSAPTLRPAIAELGRTVGRYRLTALLGEGGMGRVFEAVDTQLGRKVAVKLVRPGQGKESLQDSTARLFREAQALAQVHHPHVVQVFDVGLSESEVFVVMELIDGESAHAWCKGKPWQDIVRVFLEAGQGLEAVHAAQLIHRDFKPQNVMVDRSGTARLADFGVARAVGDSTPVEGVTPEPLTPRAITVGAIGTPAFMSPEQKVGAALDSRSDQFSFCMSLYASLYGKREAPSALPPTPPRAEVPLAVHRVLLNGLKVVPELRFESMGALLTALRSASSPPSRARRLGLMALGVGAALIAALVVAIVTRPPPLPTALVEGRDALFHHELNVARDRLFEAATLDPKNTDLLALMTWLHYWFGNEDIALETNRQALELNPPDARRRALLAQSAMISGDLGPSRAGYEELVRQHPDELEFHYGLFEAQFHLGSLDEAIAQYRATCALRADFGLGIDHIFDVYAARRDEAGLEWVLANPAFTGKAAQRIRSVRAKFALGHYAEVISSTDELFAGVVDQSRLMHLQPFAAERLHAYLVQGDLERVASTMAVSATALEKLGRPLIAKDRVTLDDVRPLLPTGDGEIPDPAFHDWVTALTLVLPTADSDSLTVFREFRVSERTSRQARYALSQLFLARTDPQNESPARYRQHANFEVSAAARAVMAERAKDWRTAAREWNTAWNSEAGATFSLLEAFAQANAARELHDDDGVLDGCGKIIEPRAFHWSWAVTVRTCLGWTAEIAERRNEPTVAAERRALAARLAQAPNPQ